MLDELGWGMTARTILFVKYLRWSPSPHVRHGSELLHVQNVKFRLS